MAVKRPVAKNTLAQGEAQGWRWQADVPNSGLGTDPEPTKEGGKMVIDSSEVWIRSLWKNTPAVNCIQGNSIYKEVKWNAQIASFHEQIAFLLTMNFFL